MTGLRAVGGQIILTNQRLVFLPHKLDYFLHGHTWEVSLRDIQRISPALPLSGHSSPRPCLCVTMNDNTEEYFLVNRLDNVLAVLTGEAGLDIDNIIIRHTNTRSTQYWVIALALAALYFIVEAFVNSNWLAIILATVSTSLFLWSLWNYLHHRKIAQP